MEPWKLILIGFLVFCIGAIPPITSVSLGYISGFIKKQTGRTLPKIQSRCYRIAIRCLVCVIGIILFFLGVVQLLPTEPAEVEQVETIVTFPKHDHYITVGQEGVVRVKWENMKPEACNLKISLINPSYGLDFAGTSLEAIESSDWIDGVVKVPEDSIAGPGGQFVAMFCNADWETKVVERTECDVTIIPQVDFVKPTQGESINVPDLSVEGTVEGELVDAELWLFLRPKSSLLFYPQDTPLKVLPDGTWGTALSLSEDWYPYSFISPAGEDLDLIIAMVTPSGGEELERYLMEVQQTGQWVGMDSLPSGVIPVQESKIQAISPIPWEPEYFPWEPKYPPWEPEYPPLK